MSYTNKGGKFLKETVVLRRWESIAGNLVLTKLATVKGKKADISSVSPSSERLGELWVVCGFICRKWSYAIDGNMVTRKQKLNKLNEKRSLIPWGLRVPIWKINFVLVFCGFPNCLDVRKGRKLPCAVLNDLGRLKCLATGLDASLSFTSTLRRCSRTRSPSRLPVWPMYNLLQQWS